MTTTISVVGTIATVPRLISPGGTILCSFRLASDERRYDREQQSWVEGHTNWFGVVCFRSLAGHAHQSFHKGDRVLVTGKVRIRHWEKEDRKGTSIEIEAEAIGHDVRWGVSRFEKLVLSSTQRLEQQEAEPESDRADAVSPTPPPSDSREKTAQQDGAEQQAGCLAPDPEQSQGSPAPDGALPPGSAPLTTSDGEPSSDGFAPRLAAA